MSSADPLLIYRGEHECWNWRLWRNNPRYIRAVVFSSLFYFAIYTILLLNTVSETGVWFSPRGSEMAGKKTRFTTYTGPYKEEDEFIPPYLSNIRFSFNFPFLIFVFLSYLTVFTIIGSCILLYFYSKTNQMRQCLIFILLE